VGLKTPVKLLKKEDSNQLVIERILHTKRYSLTLNKQKCRGCGLCTQICLLEAIKSNPTPQKKGDKKAERPTVAIDETKCNYCGMCQAICPFGALTLMVNGEPASPVVNKESFPQLIREIVVDQNKVGKECLDVKDACPLDLIKVTADKNGKVAIEIDEESCPCCGVCETKFPEGAVQVKKTFSGNLKINSDKCPKDCHICVDVCPIPDVLVVSKNKKVQVNETHCVYCGACQIACPEKDAFELTRTGVRHTDVHSGAWNKALEKVASTTAVSKELQSKTGQKRKESVKNRVLPEVLENEF
jgi:4Fe-4S ferredoxin